jgi:hypothetical protein
MGPKRHPSYLPKKAAHFQGMVNLPNEPSHIIRDVDPAWCEYVFNPVFVKLVKMVPNQWWPVVVGKASLVDKDNPMPNLITKVGIKYQQGDKNQCLFKATASALHY